MVLLSGVLWSQLIGVLCGVAANMSPVKQAFRKELSELNTFLNNNHLDNQTRFRLREYLHQSVHMKNAAAQRRILAQLSPGLHSEVVWRITQRWLASVKFLRNVEKELLIALAFHVNARVFPPEEICPHGVVYIIFKGTALYAGKMHRTGQCFGEDILLPQNAASFISSSHGIAVSYLWVYTLDAKIIRECLLLYPESAKRIKMVNTRWLMARMVIRAARQVNDIRRKLTRKPIPNISLDDPMTLLQKHADGSLEHALREHRPSVIIAHSAFSAVDSKEAAKRYAAQEAARQAEAQSTDDRMHEMHSELAGLREEMTSVKEQQERMLQLLLSRLPAAKPVSHPPKEPAPLQVELTTSQQTSSDATNARSRTPGSLLGFLSA